MSIDRPFNRPAGAFTGDGKRENRQIYENIETEKQPIPGARFDYDFNYIIDALNTLGTELDDAVVQGTIPGANVPDNANKLVTTDGEGHINFTKINNSHIDQYTIAVDRLAVGDAGGVISWDEFRHPVKIPSGNAGWALMSNGTAQPASFKPLKGVIAGTGVSVAVVDDNYRVSGDIAGLAEKPTPDMETDFIPIQDGSAGLKKAKLSNINSSLKNRAIFTTTGNGVFTVPPGVRRIFVECYGAGGGGGGAGTSYGGGGGAGGYCDAVQDVAPDSSIPLTVGAGGAGVSGSGTGGNGGNTTFNGLTAFGGAGGVGNGGAGGIGGDATGGMINIAGQSGGPGDAAAGLGWGGKCAGRYGGMGGAHPGQGSLTGRNGQNYGAGGSSVGGGAGSTSGAGANGLIVVWW